MALAVAVAWRCATVNAINGQLIEADCRRPRATLDLVAKTQLCRQILLLWPRRQYHKREQHAPLNGRATCCCHKNQMPKVIGLSSTPIITGSWHFLDFFMQLCNSNAVVLFLFASGAACQLVRQSGSPPVT